MTTNVALRRTTVIGLGIAASIGLWLLWVHLADLVAYRAPYDLWLCQIENGGAIGDPFLTLGTRALQLGVLAASGVTVWLAITGFRRRGRSLVMRVGVIVLLVCAVSGAYVLAVDAMLHPGYEVQECLPRTAV
jgi:hypothetical protein